jgi:D-sedoheptulose 7-phosphate isomerase
LTAQPFRQSPLATRGTLAAWQNDYGYDQVFARAVEAYAKTGDLVLGISTSGNSENVVRGLETAIAKECFTAALLGKDGGKLKELCDFRIIIPSENTARIQEVHSLIIHVLIELVEKELFG